MSSRAKWIIAFALLIIVGLAVATAVQLRAAWSAAQTGEVIHVA